MNGGVKMRRKENLNLRVDSTTKELIKVNAESRDISQADFVISLVRAYEHDEFVRKSVDEFLKTRLF